MRRKNAMSVYFQIQKRKYSSNVIERVEDVNGKKKSIVAVCPTLPKKEGDILCKELVKFLNKKR